MNGLDLLLLLFFGAIVGFSFMGGLGKVLSMLAGLYLGAVVAAFFYHPLALAVGTVLPTMSPFTGDLLMFVLLLALTTVAISAALSRTFFLGKVPARLGWLNNVSGGVLGVLVALLSTVLASLVISLGLQVVDRTATLGASGLLRGLQVQMQGATLVPIFLKLAPTLTTPLQLWFPAGLPAILANN